MYILRGKMLYYFVLFFDSVFDIYYKLLELNFYDLIFIKCIMKLVRLIEEDYDVILVFSFISYVEKIKFIEYRYDYFFYK